MAEGLRCLPTYESNASFHADLAGFSSTTNSMSEKMKQGSENAAHSMGGNH
jgi:hypothetical protein